MKKTLKLLAVAFAFGAVLIVPSKALAQNKFAHTNFQLVVALMTERDSAVVKLQKYGNDLNETLVGMQNDFNTKLKAYQDGNGTWSAAIKDAKEKELSDIQQRIEQFNQSAQQDYSERQQTLFAPVSQKAQTALTKVAKEGGYIYVFDTSSLLYFNDTMSKDITAQVKAELGIPASKTQPTNFDNKGNVAPAAK